MLTRHIWILDRSDDVQENIDISTTQFLGIIGWFDQVCEKC